MVVLFGILNNKYIAAHTSIPFSDYFDPRLLHDLSNELQVQVVSCNSDGLRYAFILDRGSLEKLPTHVDFPFREGDKVFVRVVYDNSPLPESSEPQIVPVPIVVAKPVDDQALVRQGVGAFLKVFDDIQNRDEVALHLSDQNPPAIVIIARDEFDKRVAEHEADRLRRKHIKELFGKTSG
jgi:hypothetical protein